MKKKHQFSTIMVMTLLVTMVLGVTPYMGEAQNGSASFVLVDFMKVEPGNEGLYLDVEKNIWKPIHQERINKGIIKGWVLYRIRYTGANDEYNYVTATLFDNPANLENPFDGIDPATVHPGKDIDAAMQKTGKSRKLVRSQLLRKMGDVYPENATRPAPFKYIQVDYMKVAPENNSMYVDVELNIWSKVHKEFLKSGARSGWSFWTRQYPSGAGLKYQYVTVNYFPDFSRIGTANYTQAFENAHGNGNNDELFQKTEKSRDLVKSELWELLDAVMKE